MSTSDGRFTMVFNGEIYNAPALRAECERAGHHFRSGMDGEVILHLWETHGPAALARLNGIFAVAVLDAVTGELFLARDPLGVKPLVYASSGDELWFASEVRALSAMGAPAGGTDAVALAQFLSFLWIPDPRTPYAGYRGLEPGTVLRWSPDGTRVSRYCAPLRPQESPAQRRPADAVAELRSRFTAAVGRQLLSDVPIALMASGGVDSSLLWWAAGAAIERAYTIDWRGSGGAEGLSDDAGTVAALSGQFGTPVTYVAGETVSGGLPRSGDLFADPAHALTGALSARAAADGFKVLLCGHGGDELFAGYRRYQVASLLRRLRLGKLGAAGERALTRWGSGLRAEYLARIARAAAEPDEFASYMRLCTYSGAADRARALGCTEAEVSDEVVWASHREVFDSLPSGLSFLRRVMALDLAVYLPGLNLAYVDRASMDQGVEVRVPWLDLDLVRWSLTLPDHLLASMRRAKTVPKALAAQVLCAEVARRPKRGFGVPAHRVAAGENQGGPGFRQSRYFALAVSLLPEHHAGLARQGNDLAGAISSPR